jgi:Protein of unknown function (DUF2997)
MAKIITVTIEDGKVTADAQGYQGKGCMATIDKLLSTVGKKVSSGHKAEYHKPATVQKTVTR